MAVTVFSSAVDGIIAALLGPLFMSLGFFIWDLRWTSSQGSAFALNMYKCNVASVWFAIMAGLRGFSSEHSGVFTVTSVGFLTLSSTLGIIIGDVLWLEALRLLGAKHVIVADSLKPFAAAILGRFVLGESLHPASWGGMVLTVIGVGAVAWEGQNNMSDDDETNNEKNRSSSNENAQIVGESHNRNEMHAAENQNPQLTLEECSSIDDDPVDISEEKQRNLKEYQRGYICAVVNVLADASGSLWTKQYGVGMTTWSINLVRFGFAGIVLFLVSIIMRLRRWCLASDNLIKTKDAALSDATVHVNSAGNTVHSSQPTASSTDGSDPKWFELPSLTRQGWLQITLGVAFVTFLCPALEKFALMQVALGLCVSLGSVGPLYGLLMEWSFKGRKPTIIVFIGVVLAIGGVIILCAFGT